MDSSREINIKFETDSRLRNENALGPGREGSQVINEFLYTIPRGRVKLNYKDDQILACIRGWTDC